MIDKCHIIQKNYQKIIRCIVSFCPIVLEYDSQSKKSDKVLRKSCLLVGFMALLQVVHCLSR